MSIQLRTKNEAWRIVVGTVGALVVTALSFAGMIGLTGQIAQAFTANDRIGPNPDWYGHSARFVLENDSNVVGSGAMYIPVFIKNTGEVENAPAKPPTDVSIRLFDYFKGYSGASLSSVRIRYPVWDAATKSCTLVYTSWASVGSSDRNFVMDKRCFTYRSDINAWSGLLTAFLQNNSGIIHFRTQITSPTNGNELFGYEADTTKFAIGARYRCDSNGNQSGCWSYYNYAIPFGTPCSEATSHYAYAYIYDPDNPAGSMPFGIQPSGFGVRVRDVTNPIVAEQTEEVPHVSGSGGNGGQYTIRFTVKPSHKYLFKINSVYTNNVLQFQLPYDSIEYIANCAWGLTPDVTVNQTDVEPPINTINVDPSVINAGPGASANVNWQLTRCRVLPSAPAAAYGPVADNTSNGVTTYNALGATCSQIGAGTTTFNKGSNLVGALQNQSIADEPVGTRICYVLSVNPPTDLSDSNVWKHSTPRCVLVVKKPKVQILGNDLIVGKNNDGEAIVDTSISTRDINGVAKIFGSWVEYAIAASGSVYNAGSGAGYAGGATNSSICSVSTLTFTNTASDATSCNDDNNGFGRYAIAKALPDVGTRLRGGTSEGASPTLDIRTLPKGAHTASGNVSIVNTANYQVQPGKWLIINAPGATVTIKDNIQYSDDVLHSASDIPQVIIIADQINIQGNVGRVDAWLIARGTHGTINTCSDVAIGNKLTAGVCSNELLVNGPVISEKLYLYRTGGSGGSTTAGVPAEKFNLRPDAYLWATEWMASSGRLQTVYTKELPPRF